MSYESYLMAKGAGMLAGLAIVLAIGAYKASTDRMFRYCVRATWLHLLGR